MSPHQQWLPEVAGKEKFLGACKAAPRVGKTAWANVGFGILNPTEARAMQVLTSNE
jgi:hypothetical protein